MSIFFKQYVYPIVVVSGGIIGVGFLSLPYIASQVGIWLMLVYFTALTAIVAVIHTIFGQVSLKTPDFKRWPGFVGFYFGKPAQLSVSFLFILGGLLTILAYFMVGSQFLYAIASPILGGAPLHYLLLYVGIASLLIYIGVSAISKFNFWALTLLLIIVCAILLKGLPYVSLDNLLTSNAHFRFSHLFLPYGAIMFSLWGTGLIPEAEEMVRSRKKSLKKIIIIATLIPALFYLLFTLLVLSITGNETTESALIGVSNVLGNGIIAFTLLVGVVTTFTACISHGLLLKKFFIYDLGIKQFPSWVFVCCIPLAIFLLGFNAFIPLISFMGAFLLGIDGILILLMYRKIGGSNMVVFPLMSVFILGMVYSIVYFMK